MSTFWTLHRLYSLDPSSLDFSRRLRSLIRHDEEEQYLTSLQGPELARLVDFLDEVRVSPSAFCPVTKRILQTLSAISADDDLSRKCLHKLQAVCSRRAALPYSCIFSGKIAKMSDNLITLGGITDVWECNYRGMGVSTKSLKVPLDNDQTLRKVCIRCDTSLSRLLKNACGPCSHFSKRPLCGKG